MTKVRMMVTQYTFNAYPDPASVNALSYDITVEYRGRGLWAVCHSASCLGKRGKWSWEGRPSSRTDRWLNAYRHDLDAALALAKKAAPLLRVNRLTAAECWTWEQARAAEVTR